MSIGNSPEDERPFEDVSEEDRPSVSVGRALQQARIAAGLTVDDISTATRVRTAIVHAIERDDFAPCGGDVYARGHIRTLAKAVKLDPAPLLAQYEAQNGGGRPAPTPAAPLFEAERIRPERRGPNWTAAMVAAIVVVIGFVGFTMVNGDDGEADVAGDTEPTASPTPSAVGKTAKPVVPAPEPSDSAIAAAPQDKVTVKVVAADGPSWISAKDHNGKMLYAGLLKKDEDKTFQDSSKIDLVLGDAGALDLFVNGKKIEDDWQPGAVERLTYTKGDPQAG